MSRIKYETIGDHRVTYIGHSRRCIDCGEYSADPLGSLPNNAFMGRCPRKGRGSTARDSSPCGGCYIETYPADEWAQMYGENHPMVRDLRKKEAAES